MKKAALHFCFVSHVFHHKQLNPSLLSATKEIAQARQDSTSSLVCMAMQLDQAYCLPTLRRYTFCALHLFSNDSKVAM